MSDRMKALARLVNDVDNACRFTILEIGALPLGGEPERFHQLVDLFPGSQIIGFEVDESLCNRLNDDAKEGFKFHPVALGEKNEELPFYETAHSMCCSLYKPNEKLLEKYNALEVVKLEKVSSLKTRSLDSFTLENELSNIDFIKIDIQGAELDVFKGGVSTLENVVAIVSEVEFISLYENQPLFGDVCQFLAEKQFMFHHFLGYAGRTLKPITLNNNPNFMSQQMWSDAFYLKDVLEMETLSNDKLLKMAVLSCLYDSVDVGFQCLKIFDLKNGTELQKKYIDLLN